MQPRHRFVGHHHGALLLHPRRQQRAGACQQVVADHQVVAGARQHDRQPPRRPPAQQRVQHPAGGGVRAFIAAIDDHVGLGVDRIAHIDQPLEDLRGIAVRQQRAVVAAGDAAQQRRPAGSAARRHRLLARDRPRLGVHEGAAAERQHQRVAGQQPADHPALAGAEVALAIAGEQFGDGAARRQLDLGIGVAERQAQSRRQPPADRGLAGAHQPDQDDAAAGERFR